MIKTRLAVVALVITGLAGSTLAADAKTYKRTRHESSMTKSSMTTGANTKSSGTKTGANTKSGTTTGMGGGATKNPSGPNANNNNGSNGK